MSQNVLPTGLFLSQASDNSHGRLSFLSFTLNKASLLTASCEHSAKSVEKQ